MAMTMMKTFAYSLAATLLASSAHAYPVGEWQCGKITVTTNTPRGADPEVSIAILTGPVGFTFNKGRPGHNFHFRFTAKGHLKTSTWTNTLVSPAAKFT
jgi:hypothetical protein